MGALIRKLQPGKIDIWYGTLGKNSVADCLSPAERQQAERFNRPEARLRYIEIRCRLRQKLAEYLQKPAGGLNIQRNEYGKPYLVDFPQLSFNLSHSRNEIALAVTEQALLGVDIEVIQDRPGLEGLAGKCFTAKEQRYWQSLSEAQKTACFYQFWTAKEAFVKAVGRGIALGLRRVEIDIQDGCRLLNIPEAYLPVENWSLQPLLLNEKTVATVCCMADSQSPEVQIHPW